MLRIGHRGAAALAPENTIQSLRLAQELGCDLVELDVLVVEETLVLAHSAAELPSERATLDEALAVLAPAGTGIQVDLKTPGVEAAVADALRRHGVLDRALVSSFHPGSLRALKGLAGARWTVPSAEQVRRLDELGVDGVIVDDPRIRPG
jgi:glycerophosphoryl diester phosphodiesterase